MITPLQYHGSSNLTREGIITLLQCHGSSNLTGEGIITPLQYHGSSNLTWRVDNNTSSESWLL